MRLAAIAGLTLNSLVRLPFLPADLPAGWLGAMVFVLAVALVAWAIVTITRAGSNVPTNRPTTTIVEAGPYRFTRNPIYLGMFLGLIGLAIALAPRPARGADRRASRPLSRHAAALARSLANFISAQGWVPMEGATQRHDQLGEPTEGHRDPFHLAQVVVGLEASCSRPAVRSTSSNSTTARSRSATSSRA